MKKITFYTLIIAFLVVGITSCGKSSKGKMTNEWKIISYQKTDQYVSQGSTTYNGKMSMAETSFTQDQENISNGSSTYFHHEGTVNSHVLTIKKDGTWLWTRDITYVFDNNTSNRRVIEESGTWSFVGKTEGDEFKKNERILFNVLTNKISSKVFNNSGPVSEESSSTNYLSGEKLQIYTIKKSKSKELELEMKTVNSVTNDSGSSTDNTSVNIILKED